MASVIDFTKAEAVRLELTSGFRRHLFSRQGPHPAGWLPSFKLRRLESNQHEDVQSVSSYR